MNKSVINQTKSTTQLEALPKKQQFSNFGHIMQKENSCEKSITLGMGDSTRKKGKPRAYWVDDIKRITKSTTLSSRRSRCVEEEDRDNHQKMGAMMGQRNNLTHSYMHGHTHIHTHIHLFPSLFPHKRVHAKRVHATCQTFRT